MEHYIPHDFSHARYEMRKYPFNELKIGDSIIVDCPKGDNLGHSVAKDIRKRMAVSACAYAKRWGMKFKIRYCEEGVRCERVG